MAISEKDSFTRKIDDKRRFALPIEVRDEFSSGVVVTQGLDAEVLYLYSRDVWEKMVEPKLVTDDLFGEIAERGVQLRMGKLDADADTKYGRVTLTAELLEYICGASNVKASRAIKDVAYFHIFPK